MNIEILHIDECPNWAEAGLRVRAALDAIGVDGATLGYRLLTSSEEAERVAFAGSPTILIDGVDAFPGAVHTGDLACRVYRTETGFAGVPTTEQLAEAIRRRL